MKIEPATPWYRLDPITQLVIVAVVMALLWAELRSHRTPNSRAHGYGWPLIHVVDKRPSPPAYPRYRYQEWRYGALVTNVLTWIALTVSSAVVTEGWLRSRWRWQFSIRTLFQTILVCAILLGIFSGSIADAWELNEVELFPPDYLRNPTLWPLIFALVCTILMLVKLAWLTVAGVCKRIIGR